MATSGLLRPLSRQASYNEWLQYLYSINLYQHVKMGLSNMLALDELLGFPSRQFDVVHVAGTNGKGSVCWKVAQALAADGKRCGLFMSPHLSTFRERMRVNDALISEEELLDVLHPLTSVMYKHAVPATFFEVTTMAALLHFANSRVDVVVLETGLGGRLDATNIVDPAVAAITSISLDHTRILGDTVPAIASEKAGILKPGRPAVFGGTTPVDILRRAADAVEAGPCTVAAGASYTALTGRAWRGGVSGAMDFDADNAATAAAVCLALPDHLRIRDPDAACAGLATRPPCRFQVLPAGWSAGVAWLPDDCPPVVLDVAHNPAGVASLLNKLHREFPCAMQRGSATAVLGMSADKDLSSCLPLVAGGWAPDAVHVVQAQHKRAGSAAALAAVLHDCWTAAEAAPAPASVWGYDDATGALDGEVAGRPLPDNTDLPPTAVARGLRHAMLAARARGDDVVVVFGSLYLMGEVASVLGVGHAADDVM